MRDFKEAGSLRMCREAAKEFDACGGNLGREWMDVERKRKRRRNNKRAAFKDNGRDSNRLSNLRL